MTDLAHYLDSIVGRNDFVQRLPFIVAVDPLAKIEMQSDVQLGMFARVLGCNKSRRPAHHQTPAGYNAPFMRFDNAAVNAGALAEIIRVHDQVLSRSHLFRIPKFQISNSKSRIQNPKSLISFASTVSALKYSSAIALAARLCFS